MSITCKVGDIVTVASDVPGRVFRGPAFYVYGPEMSWATVQDASGVIAGGPILVAPRP